MLAFVARDRNRSPNGHCIRKARWRIKSGGMLENQAIAKTGNRASGLVGPALSGMLKVAKKRQKKDGRIRIGAPHREARSV